MYKVEHGVRHRCPVCSPSSGIVSASYSPLFKVQQEKKELKESEKQYNIKSSRIQVRPRVKEGLEDDGMVRDGENCRE